MSVSPSGSDRFDHLKLGPALQRAIAEAGFTQPRPIQAKTLPEALAGRDVLGLAQTGTGKTAAFALPVLQRILADPQRSPAPRALVLAPTRELATQISEEIARLAQFTRIRVATLFGGVSASKQKHALSQRPAIVVACPGRLLDLYQQRIIALDRIEVLVLDEADHMFDMGFLPDVRKILAALPPRRQNLLFSATMPGEIRRLAKEVLHRPHVVELAHSQPVSTIQHALYPVDPGDKLSLLRRVLAEDDFVSAIVFTRTKFRARRLAQQLERGGHRAVALQGNMSQNARVRAMTGFRNGDFNVMVATDIAARGLDIAQVSHVVNFDMPQTPEAYTHRIGRTGRAEREGRAFTFVGPEDRDLVRAVEARIGQQIPRRTLDGVEQEPVSVPPKSRAAKPRGVQESQPASTQPGEDSKRPRRRRRRRRPRSQGSPQRQQGNRG